MKAEIALVVVSALGFLGLSAVEPPEKVLEGLAAEDFQRREASQILLLEWASNHGENGSCCLLRLSESSDEPEIRQRCLDVLKALSDMDYLSEGRGFLGIRMRSEEVKIDGDENPRPAVFITMVVKDSPAKKSGLVVGDAIIALDGKAFEGEIPHENLRDAIAAMTPAVEVMLTIKRANGQLDIVKVTLDRYPGDGLSVFPRNLHLLDQRAKEDHFRLWLNELEKSRD